MATEQLRILAVDPGTRFMGVAVLEGSDLIYYGVKRFKEKRPADELIRATRAVLVRLISDYRLGILAYEKTFFVQAKASALLQVQEALVGGDSASERGSSVLADQLAEVTKEEEITPELDRGFVRH